MIKELGELNEKFYELYGRLYQNIELLPPKQADVMAANLLEQYKSEYARLSLATSIDEKAAAYAVNLLAGSRIPHRWRFLWWSKANRAAETIEREIQAQVMGYFIEKEKALERLEKALDKAAEATPPAEVLASDGENINTEEAAELEQSDINTADETSNQDEAAEETEAGELEQPDTTNNETTAQEQSDLPDSSGNVF
ncbi:MAG: hypothetical protein ACI4L9_02170 [Candidatus Coproplasma sp.]